jgi:hypothetical protein
MTVRGTAEAEAEEDAGMDAADADVVPAAIAARAAAEAATTEIARPYRSSKRSGLWPALFRWSRRNEESRGLKAIVRTVLVRNGQTVTTE